MSAIIVQPSELAQWHALINEAQSRCSNTLPEDIESYLVYLLMRFSKRPEMASNMLALEFIKSLKASGDLRTEQLRDVGDKCLLFSGLFPGLAKKRHVSLSYFSDIGQSAYALISDHELGLNGRLFQALYQAFDSMIRVLQALRYCHEV